MNIEGRELSLLRSAAQRLFGQVSILTEMAASKIDELSAPNDRDTPASFESFGPKDYYLHFNEGVFGERHFPKNAFIRFIPSIALELHSAYRRTWESLTSALLGIFVYYGEPIDELKKVIQCYDLHLPEMGIRNLNDLGLWETNLALSLYRAEPLFKEVDDRSAYIVLREYEEPGWTPPGKLVYSAHVPSDFPDGQKTVDVLIGGKPYPVTYRYWKLLFALQDARPNGLKKDDLEMVNQNARKMMNDLRQDWEWQMVIGMAGPEKAGYRLM